MDNRIYVVLDMVTLDDIYEGSKEECEKFIEDHEDNYMELSVQLK